MYRNLPKSPGDGSDGSPPSEAWLFAQAILGKPIPRNVSAEAKAQAEREELERLARFSTRHAEELRRVQAEEAKAPYEREILEWAAGISTHAEEKLRALQRKEAKEREGWRRAELFVESLLEGDWDASKHPRLGRPPNAGWWARKGTGAQAGSKSALSTTNAFYSASTASFTRAKTDSQTIAGGSANAGGAASMGDETPEKWDSGHTLAATTASHTTSKGIPANFVAAQSRRGHHWVPWAAFGDLESKMTDGAYKIFASGTKSPELYDHAFDTWDSVTHGKYSGAMRQLLVEWIKTRGGKLKDVDAAKFLSWIATGKCGEDAFAAKHKKLFDTVFKWRKGFMQSIVVARAAADINPKLTAAELKAIAQQVVNGAPTKPLSKAAAKAAQAVFAGGKPLLKAAARKILPGLAFLSAATAAQRGWAGQGHVGDGAWGAFNETMRDLMIADVVEPIVFPAVLHTVDGVTNLLAPGLNAPGRNRYIRRGGRLYDLKTGRIVD